MSWTLISMWKIKLVNFHLGLEPLYYLTRDNRLASIYLVDHNEEVTTANYSSLYIDGADNNYILRVSQQRMHDTISLLFIENSLLWIATSKVFFQLGSYTGDAGDSLAYHNNRPFTTRDNDNDANGNNCAQNFYGEHIDFQI